MTPTKVPGRLLAWTALLVALVASVAANVAFARPAVGPRMSSGVAPVLVILAAGLLERVPLAGIRLWRRLTAYIGLGVVITAAFVTSFEHQYALLIQYGNPALSAVLLPVAVDGLIVLASVCLTVIAERRREPVETGSKTDVMIDSVRTIEQAMPVVPAAVPLTARVPAVVLSAVRRAMADTSADNRADSNPDADADSAPDTTADISTDAGADSNPDSRADVLPDSGPATKTSPRRTAKRTPNRTGASAPGRTPRADIAASAQRLRDRHPEWAVADIARRLGVTDRTVRRHLNGSGPTTN